MAATLPPIPGAWKSDNGTETVVANGLRSLSDGSLPYSLPPAATFDYFARDPADPFGGGSPERMAYGFQDSLLPKTYNSNSFLAGLLTNIGAGSNIDSIKQYLKRKNHAAPGIENPVPRDRFRNWQGD